MEWISVKDEMPDAELYQHADFVVLIEDHDHFDDDEVHVYPDVANGLSDPCWYTCDVTHWFVLPALPE